MSDTRSIRAYDAAMLAHTSPEMSSGPWTYVATQDEGSSRWQSHHTLVVRHEDGTFWGLSYEQGLTEYQEHEYPREGADDDDLLEMLRLFPREVVSTEYLTKSAFLRKTGETP